MRDELRKHSSDCVLSFIPHPSSLIPHPSSLSFSVFSGCAGNLAESLSGRAVFGLAFDGITELRHKSIF